MISFLGALLGTILFSFIPERVLKPRPATHSLKTMILQSLIISILFLLLTLIVQRALFSAIAISIFLIILTAVSNAKFVALKEPMVFSDFAMFSQAFKHPRLYFPFLGLAPVIIAPIIIVALIIIVLKLEPALPFTWQRITASIACILALSIIVKKLLLKLTLSLEPEKDNADYGLINSLSAYTFQAQTPEHKNQIKKVLESTPPPFFGILCSKKPNITVIQSESFFDARRMHSSINANVLKNFDRINKESLLSGKLQVPAWGANTMRSEFSFLTGLAMSEMGFYRFYPYQFINKMAINSMASYLKTQGYYCVCIHPHPASFFGRDKIFPKMGFDEFIDINQFSGAEKFGPYISDKTVTDKILEVTKNKTDAPLFIFVITMENHGPLHLEKTTNEERRHYYSGDNLNDLPDNLNDLTVYLRHLANADQMIKTLTNEYRQSSQNTTLCFYGDHVPSMPETYLATHYQDDHSDYFVWSSDQTNTPSKKDITIDSLATELLSRTA